MSGDVGEPPLISEVVDALIEFGDEVIDLEKISTKAPRFTTLLTQQHDQQPFLQLINDALTLIRKEPVENPPIINSPLKIFDEVRPEHFFRVVSVIGELREAKEFLRHEGYGEWQCIKCGGTYPDKPQVCVCGGTRFEPNPFKIKMTEYYSLIIKLKDDRLRVRIRKDRVRSLGGIVEVTGIITPNINKHGVITPVMEGLGCRRVIVTNGVQEWRPNTLDDIRNMISTIIGEDANIKLFLMAVGSIKNVNLNERIMGVVVESSNSAGKSHFMNNMLAPYRLLGMVEEFSRITGAFLERRMSGLNMNDKILLLQEIQGVPTQLHLVMSEGRLRVGVVEHGDGGRLEATEYEIEGQPLVCATTTAFRASPDFEHRSIILNLDESEEQTKKILTHYSLMANNLKYRDDVLRCFHEYENVFAQYFSGLEQKQVIIPYADELAKALQTSHDVKLRRDFRKLLNLVSGSCLLFQPNRPHIGDYVVATEEDLANLQQVISTAFRETITNLSEKEWMIINCFNGVEPLTRQKIVSLTGLSESIVRFYLDRLRAKGFIIEYDDKKPFRYELLKRPSIGFNIDMEAVRNRIEEVLGSSG